MQSIWSKTTEISGKKVPQLEGKGLHFDEKTIPKSFANGMHVQNLVIGGGLAGILTAYFLQKKGLEVILLEAGEIACGQTKNTTAKITSQHGLIYHDMIRKNGGIRERDFQGAGRYETAGGYAIARGYMMANEAVIDAYEEIIRRENIDCEFKRGPSYLYSMEEAGVKKLEQEAIAAKALGMEAHFVNGKLINELPFSVAGAVRFDKQAQFHPLKFIKAISAGLRIYENSRVLSVKKHQVFTERGTITADNIIFATHYPFPIVPGFYFLRQHQERSYVLALEGEGVPKELTGMYYGIDEGGLSFRSGEGCLLLGGGSHRVGKNRCGGKCSQKECEKKAAGYQKIAVKEGYSYLRGKAGQYYPQAREVAAWAAQDCMPHDRIPFIGKFSVFRPYWYVATGFQKWGMTTAMVAAMIISDKIAGIENPYGEVFSPQRLRFRAGIRNLCVDLGESIVGLTGGWLGKRDRRCRHMGCGLKWNPEDESWDCPCHGSRYDEDGRLLDGPAQERVKK